MRTREALLALMQELDGDTELIARVLTRNNTAWGRILAGADDPVDWGAPGFTIQTLYGVLENYFLRISRLFESSLPRDRLGVGGRLLLDYVVSSNFFLNFYTEFIGYPHTRVGANVYARSVSPSCSRTDLSRNWTERG